MTNCKKIPIILFFFFFPAVSWSFGDGTTKEDSLLTLLKTAKEDTGKVIILQELCSELRRSDYQRSLEFGLAAEMLSRKLKFEMGLAGSLNAIGLTYRHQSENDKAFSCFREAEKIYRRRQTKAAKKGLSNSLVNIGNMYRITGKYDSAIRYQQSALVLKKELQDSMGISSVYYSLGAAWYNTGNYDSAMTYYLMAVRIKESLHERSGLVGLYSNIGIIHDHGENFTKALDYYNRSLAIAQEINDRKGVATAYNNIGIVYKNLERYNDALKWLLQSMEMNKNLGSRIGVASALNSVGDCYEMKGDLTKAISLQKEALAIQKEINDVRGMTYSLNALGALFSAQKDPAQAIRYLQEALALSLESGARTEIKNTYFVLSETYYANGDHERSFEYQVKYSLLKDSLLNEESLKQLNELEVLFETEKKDKELVKRDAEILRKNAENGQRETERNAFIVAFALMLALAGIVYRFLRQKQRANVETGRQKEIIEQKQTEIIDSIRYASRIQRSMMPSQRYIDKCFKSMGR